MVNSIKMLTSHLRWGEGWGTAKRQNTSTTHALSTMHFHTHVVYKGRTSKELISAGSASHRGGGCGGRGKKSGGGGGGGGLYRQNTQNDESAFTEFKLVHHIQD